MTADWFKSITDVLADQLFALQLIRLRAAECNTLVTEILDSDRTCDGIFLALSELQDCRRQLVDRFDECPVKFQWNVLYCLCAIEVLVMEVFVDDKHLERVKLVAETMKRAANTRDLDSLVTERLLFDFFWRSDEDLLTTLKTTMSSAGFLCTQRCLPTGSVFAPIPCTQCRFDHAFSPEAEIVGVSCTHLAASLAPLPPDTGHLVPDLPSEPNKKTDASSSCRFPTSDRLFDHLGTPDHLADIMNLARSSHSKTPCTAPSIEAARSQLMSSRALRDCREERAELSDIRSAIQQVVIKRREATSCKGVNEWLLLRLVNIIDALARRCSRSSRAGPLPSIDPATDRAACERLRRNLRGMVLQDTEYRHLIDTFNDLVLDPLTRGRQRIFRPYIDSRKLMYAIGIPPGDILVYDRSISEVTNKTVFELRSSDPRDRFFKAVFVSGLFRLYLNSIGCDARCLPNLFRADDRKDVNGFCFAVDGCGVVAVIDGRYFARGTSETILQLCIAWIRDLLALHFAGDATDSLSHLLEATI